MKDVRDIFLRLVLSFVVLSFFSAASFAQSKTINLLTPMINVGLISSLSPPKPGSLEFYSWTGPKPAWKIAQWNIPGNELSPFTSSKSSGKTVFFSASQEASVKIIKTDQVTEISLSQDGTILPCSTNGRKPRESDLLISPNSLRPKPPGVPGMALLGKNNPPLSSLESLEFSTTLSIFAERTKNEKGCGFNVGKTSIGIILSDQATQPPQTMFYQLAFSKFCGNGSAQQIAFCNANHTNIQVFRKSPFGMDDFLLPLGMPMLQSGQTSNVNVNVLPRLKLLIRKAPPGTDRDPSHWVVGGIYIGQSIWGDITLQSKWRSIKLIAHAK